MADDEYSVPGDVVEGVGGRTYSGGTFSGILPHPWPKRRPSTYSNTSRGSQVTKLRQYIQILWFHMRPDLRLVTSWDLIL